jgi:hypothetical protein
MKRTNWLNSFIDDSHLILPSLLMLADMWIILTFLIILILGLAVLYLVRNHKKVHSLANTKKLEPPKERIIRQKQWEETGNTPQPRRKRSIEEIKQEILRAQEVED